MSISQIGNVGSSIAIAISGNKIAPEKKLFDVDCILLKSLETIHFVNAKDSTDVSVSNCSVGEKNLSSPEAMRMYGSRSRT